MAKEASAAAATLRLEIEDGDASSTNGNLSIQVLENAKEEEEDQDLVPVVIGPYPSYSMGPMEILLIILLFVVWFYALRRFYTVWSNVLNFSAISADSFGTRQTRGIFYFFARIN